MVKRTVYFFCRKCLKSYKVFVEHDININYFDQKTSSDVNINFTYKCDCGNTAEEIDSMMIGFIERLNRMGFYTDYCCEGHSSNDRNIDSGTYIKFLSTNKRYTDGIHILDKRKEKYLKKFLKKTLPELLVYRYDSKWTKSLSIEIDYESRAAMTILKTEGFNKLKEMALVELSKVISKLELASTASR